LIGPGFVLVGSGLMLMRGITPASSWTHLLAGMIVAGLGAGLVNVPLAATAVGVVDPARAGMASGINSTFRQVGTATGVAALGSILASHIRATVTHSLQHVAAHSQSLRPAGAQAHLQGFIGGLNLILLIGACLAFGAAAITLIAVRQGDLAQPLSQDGPPGPREAEPGLPRPRAAAA
jgi:hypothetical protein